MCNKHISLCFSHSPFGDHGGFAPLDPPPAFEKAGTKLYVFISRFYFCVFNYLISYEMTIIKKNSCPLSFENEQLFSEHSACKKYSRTNDSKSGYYQESPCK